MSNNLNSIFIWHSFEQFEAYSLDKILSLELRKEAFENLTNVVDLVENRNICNGVDREWMLDRLEEIVSDFPELVS